MKEYSIYIRQGSGKPYYLKSYSSLTEWSTYSEEEVIREAYNKIVYINNFKN